MFCQKKFLMDKPILWFGLCLLMVPNHMYCRDVVQHTIFKLIHYTIFKLIHFIITHFQGQKYISIFHYFVEELLLRNNVLFFNRFILILSNFKTNHKYVKKTCLNVPILKQIFLNICIYLYFSDITR